LLWPGAENGESKIYLKLENLQPTGSFKVRGAANALLTASPEQLRRGVYTASSGNMAQGLAYCARSLGIDCSAVIPDNASQTKIDGLMRLGARIVKVPYAEWWRILTDHGYRPMSDLMYVDAVNGVEVLIGVATMALEILDVLPEPQALFVPFGCGGLCYALAAVFRVVSPRTRVVAVELETGAPLASSLACGAPTAVEYRTSFVDGIGAGNVLEEMWPPAAALVDDVVVVTLAEVAAAIRDLARGRRLIVEGAAGAALAAAQTPGAVQGRVVSVLTGGNLELSVLTAILKGQIPNSARGERDEQQS
jgi:threonine dehydratase